jgi:hypothetical protein
MNEEKKTRVSLTVTFYDEKGRECRTSPEDVFVSPEDAINFLEGFIEEK